MAAETRHHADGASTIGHAPTMPIGAALCPLLCLAGWLGWQWTTAGELGNEAVLSGLLLAAGFAAVQARWRGQGFAALQASIGRDLANVLPVLLILLSIGILIGAWIVSGTIPALIYVGLRTVAAEHFILTAFFATALMSLCTGTSWGSAASVGVALMGIATAIGAPLPATAGAVISGAYFGDKLSPLSDSTNICALAARCELIQHIRGLLQTSLPATLAAALVFAWLDAYHSNAQWNHHSVTLLTQLETLYPPNGSALLPVVAVLVGLWRGLPACPTMLLSALVAVPIGYLVHGVDLLSASQALVSGFKLEMLPSARAWPPGTEIMPILAGLLERGGLLAMSDALPLIILAFSFTAGLRLSGALATLLHVLRRISGSRLGLVVATLSSGFLMIGLTSHGGVSALFVGELFHRNYLEQQLHPANLSRCLEESITVVDPLLPWTVSGIFMAQTLGVSTLDYAAFAVFAWLSPIFSLALALYDQLRGRGLTRLATTN